MHCRTVVMSIDLFLPVMSSGIVTAITCPNANVQHGGCVFTQPVAWNAAESVLQADSAPVFLKLCEWPRLPGRARCVNNGLQSWCVCWDLLLRNKHVLSSRLEKQSNSSLNNQHSCAGLRWCWCLLLPLLLGQPGATILQYQ